MSNFSKTRKARKDYECSAVWAHDQRIYKGEIYTRVIIPPDLPGDEWDEYYFHPECLEDE